MDLHQESIFTPFRAMIVTQTHIPEVRSITIIIDDGTAPLFTGTSTFTSEENKTLVATITHSLKRH